MELSPYLIWIIGGLAVVVITVVVAKKAKITFDGKEISILTDKTENNKMKSNKLVIKGNNNVTKQDVNNKDKNTYKNNEMEIEGDGNETDQDVNNSDKEQKEQK